MLTDPEARAEAFRFAEELEAAAATVGTELSAEMLVKAADIYLHSLGDAQAAVALLRRAVTADPRCALAMARMRDLAESRSDHALLAEALEHMIRISGDPERARLIAERGDVLGRKLGRIAEARGLYREVARLAPIDEVRSAALAAAEEIDRILAERRPTSPSKSGEWRPVAPLLVAHEEALRAAPRTRAASTVARADTVVRAGPVVRSEATLARGDAASSTSAQLFRRAAGHLEKDERAEALSIVESGLAVDPDSEQGRQILERLLLDAGREPALVDAYVALASASKHPVRARAALRRAAELAVSPLGDIERGLALYRQVLERDPVDEQAFADAVSSGLARGILDVAARVLPRLDPPQRAELLFGLAQAASVVGDAQAADDYLAATFDGAPEDLRAFEAAVRVLHRGKNERGFARVLEQRLRATRDAAERRALAFELAAVRDGLGDARGAAEALIQSLTASRGEEDVSDALTAIDRLSRDAGDRALLSRAYGAAAARDGIDPTERAGYLRALARVLEELGDLEAAAVAVAEAEATTPALPAPIPPGLLARMSAVTAPELEGVGVLAAAEGDPFAALHSGADAEAPVRGRVGTARGEWRDAVGGAGSDTLIDVALTAEHAERLRAAVQAPTPSDRSDLPGGSGRWVVGAAPESVDGMRMPPPLLGDDHAGRTPSAVRAAPITRQTPVEAEVSAEAVSALAAVADWGETLEEPSADVAEPSMIIEEVSRIEPIPPEEVVPHPELVQPEPDDGELEDQRAIDTEDIPRPKRAGRPIIGDVGDDEADDELLEDVDVDLGDLDAGATRPEPTDPGAGPFHSGPDTVATTPARASTPPPIPRPQLPADPRDRVRWHLRAGQLDAALAAAAGATRPGEGADVEVVLELARLARAFGRDSEVAQLLGEAVAAGVPAAAERLCRELAALHLDAGRSLEAAQVLAPSTSSAAPGTPEAQALAGALTAVARARAEEGAVDEAVRLLEVGLAVAPGFAAAAGALAALHGGRGDGGALAALEERMSAAPLAGSERARWLAAVGRARMLAREPELAYGAARRAMAADPYELAGPEVLVALGAEVSEPSWIAEGLRELEARALAQDLDTRAFAAAAARAALGGEPAGDRLTYARLRVALARRPRAPIGSAWFEVWASPARGPAPLWAPAVFGPEVGGDVPRGAREMVEVARGLAEVVLGTAWIEVRVLESPGTSAVFRGSIPTIGIARELLREGPGKRLTFEVARAVAALSSEGLARALGGMEDPAAPSPELLAIDRAGLVLAGDPAVALEAVGPTTARGRALLTFAASAALTEAWDRVGAGLHRDVANGRFRG